MRELAGKTAFVTGGASGIGFALGHAFAAEGMNVMLADIEAPALTAAVDALRDRGANARGVLCDVADAASVDAASAKAFAAFGNVHVVCNNAGVGGGTGIDDISPDSWRWLLDVNVMGVVHGVHAFLPHMRAHGEGGHIVNTASMAGLNSGMGFSAYSASKFAVVNMSEGLAARLQPIGIGVTVVCPGYVRTRIGESGRNRQQRYGPPTPPTRFSTENAQRVRSGMDPSIVAALTLEAIREDALYVFPHPDMRDEVEERFASILAALEKAEARSQAR